MHETHELLLIGDGRLARHLARYFAQLGINHAVWSRRLHREERAPALAALVGPQTHVLLAISDGAIQPFIASHPELEQTVRIHFSGGLASALAIGAHPLFSFAGALFERDLYERIPFVIDEGAPSLSSLIPGLPNPHFFIKTTERARYHALCVLAGNFTTLLWRKLFFELAREFGIPGRHALPYLESVAGGLARSGAPLSGPLARGDSETVARNLEALKGDPFEGVYRAFVCAFEQQQKLTAEDKAKDWLSP
ncbi:MAG TPA: DUF2520 domain-containing protein [Rhizomicrobium sp.]|jgi:predicted short-subunit dehydrogenase-like oxidoreductase (DUF2520 family)